MEIPDRFKDHKKKLCVAINEKNEVLMIRDGVKHTPLLITQEMLVSVFQLELILETPARDFWIARIDSRNLILHEGYEFLSLATVLTGLSEIQDKNSKEEGLFFLLLNIK